MASSLTESALISALESSNSSPIYSLFSDFLRPFADLKPPKTQTQTQTQTLARSLAKQFLPFLNRSLAILPRHLLASLDAVSKGDAAPTPSELVLQQFDTYRLCLDCVDLLSSQLSVKPHALLIQRVRMVYCLVAWGLYGEAEKESFWVLGRLRGMDLGVRVKSNKKNKKKKLEEYVPALVEKPEPDLVRLVVDTVLAVVRCVALAQSKDREDYEKVLVLVEEFTSWFRLLDANAYEKLKWVLLSHLEKCTIYLVRELVNFDKDVVCAFSLMALDKYTKFSMEDQIFKFARRVCSSLFLLRDDSSSVVIDVLICVLDSLGHHCKDKGENCVKEFIELVSYCANKCRNASADFCSMLAEHLNNIASDSFEAMAPFDSILRLYIFGLSFTDLIGKSRVGDIMTFNGVMLESSVSIWLGDGVRLCKVAPVLDSLRSCFKLGCGENYVACGVECKHSSCQLCSETSSTSKNIKLFLPVYLNALEFFCHPFAEQVNSDKKRFLGEKDASSLSFVLSNIQEAFQQLCEVFLFLQSSISDRLRDGLDDNKMILGVAIASFTLSIKTKTKLKESMHLIQEIIGSDWIRHQGLKYLYVSLYNVGVHLFRNNEANEASKALKLSCRAAWTRVILLCRIYLQKFDESLGELSEDAISDFLTEACTRTAFLLDVQHKCSSPGVKRTILKSLEKWSVAEDLIKWLPCPLNLVKQWVKMECKQNTSMNEDDIAPTLLYSLLSSSVRMSKRAIGKILEQEIHAYEDLDAVYPAVCQRMKIEIIDILLRDVYITGDSYLQKSRTLVRKACACRALGFKGLADCIQCLSEAITIISSETCSSGAPTSHQLALAYCLRALSTQEAEPNSKQVSRDIQAALDIWLSIPVQDYEFAYGEGSVISGFPVLLLYNVIDILAIKGSMEFHHDIYELMIRLFRWKNVPLEKFFSVLWESRRLSHALCASPINDAIIMSLSAYSCERSNRIEFWMHCLKGSLPSVLGFQQHFSHLSPSCHHGTCNCGTSSQLDGSVEGIRRAAIQLTSSVPVASCSIFFAGYLYHDLSEKLIVRGRLFEALLYAKEAYRLRTKLFQEKFAYSVEQQVEKHNKGKVHDQKLGNMQVHKSIANEVWLLDTTTSNLETCYLSPWKVLQCYLESTLQVGIIHEITGNGVEAETFLRWGKSISCSQDLPLFIVAFSSVLGAKAAKSFSGKLYRKKRFWDLSQRELQSAKDILVWCCMECSCTKCKLIFEATVDQELGDLSRSHILSSPRAVSEEKSSYAENFYRSALDKLNLSEWKNSISCPDEVNDFKRSSFCSATSQPDGMSFVSVEARTKTKMESRKSRSTRSALRSSLKEKSSITGQNTRLTRSRLHSQSQNANSSTCEQVEHAKQCNGSKVSDLSDTIRQKPLKETDSCGVEFGCKSACSCNNMKCWFCLIREVDESGLLRNFVLMKWESVRRRLSLRVFMGIGKCLGALGLNHRAHEIFLQSISTLVERNPFSCTYAPVPPTFLLDMVGKEYPGDLYAVERSAILYNMCWLSLKSYHSNGSRTICCEICHIQLPKLISWLRLAFVLCREVPVLFQKVSRLLSVIYVISSVRKQFYLASYCKVLSESHWASYFHQASLGTHLNYQFFSNMTGRWKSQQDVDYQGLSGVPWTDKETSNLLRLVPDTLQDMEKCVIDFFADLPSSTIICISLIGDSDAKLLQDLLKYPSHVHAWLLLSRFNSKSQPIVLLLPVGSVLKGGPDDYDDNDEDDDAKLGTGELSDCTNLFTHWPCPWDSTVVDDIAPAFKLILEKNYSSSLCFPLEETKKVRDLWWARRKKIDCHLGKFLRNLEDLWFGPWRCVLLGEQSDHVRLESIQKKVVHNLKSKCKVDVNEGFLRVILGAESCWSDGKKCISQLLSLENGCFVGEAQYSAEEKCDMIPEESEGLGELSALAMRLLFEAVNEISEGSSQKREAVILVLDSDVQMLPWENLPVLRNQEVYRMPSVASICLTLDRSCHHVEVRRITAAFPFIDPLDAFYLLNPSGDLSSTQVEFENWFRDKKLEGKAGCEPAAEELALALKNHDLFIYMGHGSGSQYISKNQILKLENCAATLLMGCSSGSLSLDGCYVPQGTPLNYLLAGSPVIVGNLWEVTDREIDRFGKAMLDAWLKERCSDSMGCIQCKVVAEEFEAMNLRCSKATKRKVSKKTLPEPCENASSKGFCDHGPKLGSFMAQAREVCLLPFLTGASPVCYGIPTGIRRKKDL